MAEIWNGKHWSITPSPQLPLGWTAALSGVSCVSPTRCVAVGTSFPPDVAPQTLVEIWNGNHWSIKATPTYGNISGRNLNAVSCVSLTRCFAVGTYGYGTDASQTLIETWDGTRWSVMDSPNYPGRPTASNLVAVSCVTATGCVAVGYATWWFGVTSITLTAGMLLEKWDGTRWSVTPSPEAGTLDWNQLAGVSCTSQHCEAVGFYESGPLETSQTLGLTGP